MNFTKLTRGLMAIAMLVAAASTARAETITFGYDFIGGLVPVTNPGAFGPNSISPAPSIAITPPTFTASAAPIGGTGVSNVIQHGLGLSVYTDPDGSFNGEVLGGLTVDSIGSVFGFDTDGSPEELRLTFSNTDPNLINAVVTSVQLGYTNIGNVDDIEVFLNGVSQGTFDFPTLGLDAGILSLPNIAITNGDMLAFRPLADIISDSNFFTVQGLTIQATVTPEPLSLAVWGTVSAVGAVGAWRHRRRSRAATNA